MLRRKIYIPSYSETFQVSRTTIQTWSKLSGKIILHNFKYNLRVYLYRRECSSNVSVRRNDIHTSSNKRTVFSKQLKRLPRLKTSSMHLHTLVFPYMYHIEIRRCRDDAGQTGRKIQRIPHFLRSRRSLWIRDEFRHVRTRRASQKGTKHKSRIINLQGTRLYKINRSPSM